MLTRREAITRSAALVALMGSAGLLPQAAQAAWEKSAFDAKNLTEVLKALGAGAPAESAEVSLTAPDIAENGAVVPVGIATNLAGVKRMLVLVEKNPNLLSAIYEVSPSVEANFSTRVKMGQSSDVYAVALMGDGRTLYARKEVKVTLGGCGG
ncbi:thiosulfate oxidation carrier protein SoxY [Hylemonella gracilis]|uniref:Thiosulfate oxidation carrier protein SoxY n=1 Tax=Hylemonella gracilis TaxID=80880 RepID=A0A4P6UJR4_9BURK|nr:thiosulfate oxidation carrier protein SoxY [Hylemonella gracilis]QBK03591.1 thiosulfate oxidation carrier protein SoxY [Hylemonella gracilis]